MDSINDVSFLSSSPRLEVSSATSCLGRKFQVISCVAAGFLFLGALIYLANKYFFTDRKGAVDTDRTNRLIIVDRTARSKNFEKQLYEKSSNWVGVESFNQKICASFRECENEHASEKSSENGASDVHQNEIQIDIKLARTYLDFLQEQKMISGFTVVELPPKHVRSQISFDLDGFLPKK